MSPRAAPASEFERRRAKSIESPPATEVRFVFVRAPSAGALAMLSEDELARARRFVSEGARRRFVAGRALLRELVGELLDASPAALRFEPTAGGKPELAEPWRGAIEFSVSHSGELAVVAASHRPAPIGIDVEAVRPVRRARVLAERYFEADAAALVARLAGAERDAAFLRHWTRLEAAVKATGGGTAAILAGARDWPAHEALDVSDLRLPPGYVGAVAVAASRPARLESG